AVVDIDNGTGPYTYSWSNGATTRVDPNLLPGSYNVCVTDANHCTACDTVTVGVITPHCHASFYLRRDTTASVTYFAVSNSLGLRPFHYLWTWGDGSPADTARHPIHTYANPGAYTICLTITTANGCTSTWCRTLNAHSPTTDPFAPLKIAVIDEPETATGVTEQTEGFSWNLYPNPASDQSMLSYTHAQTSDIQIYLYDLSGRLVNSIRNMSAEPGGEYQLTINTAGLREGSYLIQIRTSTSSDTKRLNVIH
ncbi:MAG TPA: T9SS type A sorting domain-containing protein, partial [Bacteroidia bacterium]|nr:T9SS type A sorting domain-containing protein [Bacteroidia bacterium]